jgi:hypothetical protein
MFLKTDAGIPLDLRVGYRRSGLGAYNVERVRGYLRKESWMQQERSFSRARQAGTRLCNRLSEEEARQILKKLRRANGEQ